MNNTLKLAAIAAPLAVVAYAALSKNATLDHLYAKYPDLDPKIAKSAYRKMMAQALRQEIDMSNWNEEQFDKHFMLHYKLLEVKFVMPK